MHHHFTWSIDSGDKCPKCGGETTLICAGSEWSVHSEEPAYRRDGCYDVRINAEVTGHFCIPCRLLVSLSMNQTTRE